MLIDTHSHLNFNAYKNDSVEVIKRSLDNDIGMINVGSQYSTSRRAVALAENYVKGVYAAVGLHPIHLETGLVKIKTDPEEIKFQTLEEEFNYEKYKELAESKKVVAIGEIGLDYYWKPKTKGRLELFKQKQKDLVLKEIALAGEVNLPIIFHCRMAHQELLEIMSSKLRGVIHCFTGTWEQAEKYLSMGFYLGFNGIIFKLDLDEIIKKTPLDRILIETDCPYLTPPQENGRNEPSYIKHVAEKISKLKDQTYEEVIKITTENAQKLFKI